MFQKVIIISALVLLLITPAFAAGSATLYGAVNDNGQALAGAMVTIIGEASYTSKTVATNDQGIYLINNLPADEYIIRVIGSPDGMYKTAEKNVFLGPGKEKEVNFSMKKN